MKQKEPHYISNKELLAEILGSKEQDELTTKAVNMILLLARRVTKRMRYTSDADRDDCAQSGLEMVFKNWRNFNPEMSTNAFAYFTEIYKRGMAKGWNETHFMKGDAERKARFFSLESSNDGTGIFNI